MKYITTALLMFMTAALIICGTLLWRRRKETGDYSRTIQAILSWVSAFFTFTFIFRTWAGTAPADATLFEPEHTFVPLLCQMTFFFYPLEVIRPTQVVWVAVCAPAPAGHHWHVWRYSVHFSLHLFRSVATFWRVQRMVPHTHPHHHAFLLFLTLPCPL